MSTISFVASVLLGVAFVVAGGSKLAGGQAWSVQAHDLGAPRFLIPTLPLLELGVGGALIVQLLEPVPAVIAIVLLVGFTALIGVRLQQGRHPACACFGTWSAKPIGPAHLARNAALMLLGLISLYP